MSPVRNYWEFDGTIREVEHWIGYCGVISFKGFKDQKEACQSCAEFSSRIENATCASPTSFIRSHECGECRYLL